MTVVINNPLQPATSFGKALNNKEKMKAFLVLVLVALCLLNGANAYARSRLPVSPRILRDNSAGNTEVDTVVARCTRKISESLNPVKISVTGSNDDPNGSHVSAQLCIMRGRKLF